MNQTNIKLSQKLLTRIGRGLPLQIFVFVFYTLITVCIFWSRIQFIFTHYGLSGIDTDGTLWFYWARTRALLENTFFPFNNSLIGFPFGFDMSAIPYKNLVYDGIVFLNSLVVRDGEWSVIIFLSNLFSLLSYPITSYFAFRMLYSIVKNAPASFLGGVMFGFSFYFLRYSGGALSLNQLWVVPLYFWCLINTAKNNFQTRDILVTAFVNAITFAISPYWGGYNVFFTPIIMLGFGGLPLGSRLGKWVVVLIHFMWVFACINGEFIITHFTILSVTQANAIGYVSDYLVQAIGGVYQHFTPHNRSALFSQSLNEGYFYLGTVSLGLYFIFLIRSKRNRLITIIHLCFLISIVVSTSVGLLQGVSESIYKLYLRFFRAISRVHLYSLLFIGVIAAESFKSLASRYSKPTQIFLCTALCLFVLLENYSSEKDWLVRTDMNKLEALYSDVKENPDVSLVISYPLVEDVKYPIPTTYQYIAQMIHGKTMVNGFNVKNTQHMRLMRDLINLTPEVIDTWQDIGVDLVILYPDRIRGINEKLELLVKDERVQIVGKRSVKIDEHLVNRNSDTVVSVILLKITKKLPNEYYIAQKSQLIELRGNYKKISSSGFQLMFNEPGKNKLTLNYPFDPRWLVISTRQGIINNITNLRDIRMVSSRSGREGKTNDWNVVVSRGNQYYLFWQPDLLSTPFIYLRIITLVLFTIAFLSMVISNLIKRCK